MPVDRPPARELDLRVQILVLDSVEFSGQRLILEIVGRRRKGSNVTKVRQVDARGDQSTAVSQDAEAHHAQGAAGVSH